MYSFPTPQYLKREEGGRKGGRESVWEGKGGREKEREGEREVEGKKKEDENLQSHERRVH